MTAPVSYKSVKVSPQTHAQIHDLAQQLGASADEALAHVLDSYTIRIRLSPLQHERWTTAAAHAGMTVAAFVQARIEAALTYGTDPGAFGLMYRNIAALCTAAGITPARPPASTPQSTTGTPPVDR